MALKMCKGLDKYQVVVQAEILGAIPLAIGVIARGPKRLKFKAGLMPPPYESICFMEIEKDALLSRVIVLLLQTMHNIVD